MVPAPSCPSCGHRRSWSVRRSHRKCTRCRREWSPRTQYPVPDLRLCRREWQRIITTFLRDGTIRAVAQEGALAYDTAQHAVTVLRGLMACDYPAPFSGICEADETYVGGKWRNKPAVVRARGTKRGRGTTKQGVLGILCRETGTVRLWLIDDAGSETLCTCIRTQVHPGSTIYTDDWEPYTKLRRYGYLHEAVRHRDGEYVRGDVHTQGIEGYWGLLKQYLAAKGGIRRKKLPLFLGEHLWRYNHRSLPRTEQRTLLYQLVVDHAEVFGGKS